MYYPNHYGTFFAFAEDNSSVPTLCACAKDPIRNLTKLREITPSLPNADPRRMAPLDSGNFPDVIVERVMALGSEGVESVHFIQSLCHRCNLVPPSFRYCHEMYGGKFIQHFGWYVNQAYLRIGISPMLLHFLPDVCPPEFRVLIERAHEADKLFQKERQRLTEIVSGPPRDDFAPDEVTYWHNVREDEAEKMISLRRKAGRAKRAVTKKIENIVREEFGFKKVGEAWVSETLLFQHVTRIVPESDVLRHHRPDWAEGLELDIYIPSAGLAIEYQGQQHYHPVEAWGGRAALEKVQERDRRKAALCEARGIKLIHLLYTEPITEEHIRRKLAEAGLDFT